MLEVDGRPFLEYNVERLRRSGVDQVVMSCGFLGHLISQHFGDGSRFGLQIDYSFEDRPLGTGGAVRNALSRLDERFFLLNGDTLFDVDLAQLGRGLIQSKNLAVLAARMVPDISRFGSIELSQGQVARFHGKGGAGAGYCNGGVYAMTRSAVDLLGSGSSSLESQLLPRLAAEQLLGGNPSSGFFIDIGIPEDLERAQTAIPDWKARG
jgi:NDP-sugar pyrophosphorylase family protein